jgi:hypothetical protein
MRVDAKRAKEPKQWNSLPQQGASLMRTLTRSTSSGDTTEARRAAASPPGGSGSTTGYADDDNGDDDCVLDPSAREMNYYVLIVFHSDAASGPCNPVVQVVHLVRQEMPAPVVGGRVECAEIFLNCQLCGSSVRGASKLRVEAARVTAVYALSLTDIEANIMIHSVQDVSMTVCKHDISVSQRSNLALLPRVMHKSVPIGMRALDRLHETAAVTDVQLGILVLRESLNRARAISVQLQRLHPFFATPSNLQEAVATFTRRVSVTAFLRGQFIFLPG